MTCRNCPHKRGNYAKPAELLGRGPGQRPAAPVAAGHQPDAAVRLGGRGGALASPGGPPCPVAEPPGRGVQPGCWRGRLPRCPEPASKVSAPDPGGGDSVPRPERLVPRAPAIRGAALPAQRPAALERTALVLRLLLLGPARRTARQQAASRRPVPRLQPARQRGAAGDARGGRRPRAGAIPFLPRRLLTVLRRAPRGAAGLLRRVPGRPRA